MLMARAFLLTAGLAFSLPLTAQVGRQLTREDYLQAERFMAYETNPLVFHTFAAPTFLPDGRFWYRDHAPDGVTFLIVDPVRATKGPAFDHARMATALNKAMAMLTPPPGMGGGANARCACAADYGSSARRLNRCSRLVSGLE